MARLIVGSEGTLLTVVEAKMRLVRRPKKTALDVIHYHDMQEALESSQSILETGALRGRAHRQDDPRPRPEQHRAPPAHGLRAGRSRRHPHRGVRGRHRRRGPREGRGPRGAPRRARGAATPRTPALDPAEQQSIWKLRKAGLGLLFGVKGDAKPIAFVEDTAVDPKHLAAFVPRFPEIMRSTGRRAPTTATARWAACTSARVIDLKTTRGLEQVRAVADEIFDLVLEFGGAISSEHGDGRARSPFLERVFGPTLFQAFREFKSAFDPKNRMNPGNIVDSPGVTENLRYGA